MKSLGVLLASLIVASALTGSSAAQTPTLPAAQLKVPTTASAPPSNTSNAASTSTKPFAARIEVDTLGAISYGDDIPVTVWITPQSGLDLESIRIFPKGDLAKIYGAPPDGPKDAAGGILCDVTSLHHQPGVEFPAICLLSNKKRLWKRWLDVNALLDPGRQQFTIDIGVRDHVDGDAIRYTEFGHADFISPRSAIILGGLLGALAWTIFLAISTPIDRLPTRVASWGDLIGRMRAELPQASADAFHFTSEIIRTTLLGGTTALVLIVIARSTEGIDPPISIHIQDFWGGVMVGLVSTPMARWIKDKLSRVFSDDVEKEPAEIVQQKKDGAPPADAAVG